MRSEQTRRYARTGDAQELIPRGVALWIRIRQEAVTLLSHSVWSDRTHVEASVARMRRLLVRLAEEERG